MSTISANTINNLMSSKCQDNESNVAETQSSFLALDLALSCQSSCRFQLDAFSVLPYLEVLSHGSFMDFLLNVYLIKFLCVSFLSIFRLIELILACKHSFTQNCATGLMLLN